jgi:hypothetical protein
LTIKDLILQNKNILQFLKEHGRDYEHADLIFPKFISKLIETNCNSALSIDFANVCQCLNNHEYFNHFTLEEISDLFSSIIKLEPYNIEAYSEYAHFEWSVLDRSKEALEIAKLGLKNARSKVKELESLIKIIESK